MPQETSVQKYRKQKKFYTWSAALLLAGSVLLLNYILGFVPLRLDASEGRIFSISKGTKDLLSDLDDRLVLKMVFSSELPPQFKRNEQYVRDLLVEYRRASGGHIYIEYLDPGKSDKARVQAMRSGITPVQIDVRKRDRRELSETFMGLTLHYRDKSDSISFIQDTTGLEYEISSRIKRMVFPGFPKIGIISNAGAMTFASQEIEKLQAPVASSFEIVPVSLTEEIPKDLKALWLLGPKEALSEEELNALKIWLREGGTLGLMLDQYDVDIQYFRARQLKNDLDGLLEEWGLRLQRGLVVDPQSDRIQVQSSQGYFQMVNIVDYPFFPLIRDVNREHPTTKSMDGVALPFVSSLKQTTEIKNVTFTSLLRSSKYSWVDPVPVDLSPVRRRVKPDAAEEGPFDLAVLLEGKFGDRSEVQNEDNATGRLIVFGTSRFIRTDYPPRTKNYTMFLNFLDWSVQDEKLLAIRSKGVKNRPLKRFSDTSRALLKYGILLFLPLLSIFIGLFIWRRQRIRRALLPLKYQEV